MACHFGPHGIRANSITPGYTDTPMQRAGFSPAAQAYIDGTQIARQANPSEVASVAVFLASQHASFGTGAIMNVSGGARMG
jgi:NAD(P)-dependent dehydrogenase (short-subunit alcohol dehydrogenase family)